MAVAAMSLPPEIVDHIKGIFTDSMVEMLTLAKPPMVPSAKQRIDAVYEAWEADDAGPDIEVLHEQAMQAAYDDGFTAACKLAIELWGSDMANVYEGAPDGRQSDDPAEPLSRFRPRYRALSDDEKALHDEIKTAYAEVERLINHVGPGRYSALALTTLEESCMWCVKSLTENKPKGE
jgi:hypothetical protein